MEEVPTSQNSEQIQGEPKKKKRKVRSDGTWKMPKGVLQLDKPGDFMAFAEWIATPSEIRVLKTQKELAGRLAVDEDTLTSWKKHRDFYPMVTKLRKRYFKDHDITDLVYGLVEKNKKTPNGKDIKVILEYVEDMGQKVTFEDVTPAERRFTPDQKTKIMEVLERMGIGAVLNEPSNEEENEIQEGV